MRDYTIEKLAAQLKIKKNDKEKAVLFLGAGASFSAGIPLAGGIMKDIEEDDNLNILIEGIEKDYGKYFAELNQSQAKGIFDKYIKKSKINLAHLYACHLMKEGYVDCIVTTNFDPLVVRTLSIYDIQPSIYDLTVARDNISSDLSYPAVVYLHGQNNGFWRLNSNGEFDIAKETIAKTLNKIIMGRPMIIIGYSGNNDPVFEQLAAVDNYADNLYWVTYKNDEPASNVKIELLDKHTKGAYCIKGYDADQFFRKLCNKLDTGLPNILHKPFSHLKGLIDNIADIKLDEDNTWEELVQVNKIIDGAIKTYEGENKISKSTTEKDLIKYFNEILMSEEYEKIEEFDEGIINGIIKSKNNRLKYSASSAFFNWGNSLANLADIKMGGKAETLYKEAIAKFKKAIDIKGNYHEAFNYWGFALYNIAITKTGKEAESLHIKAIEKYKKATEIKDDKYIAFNNWGIALDILAKTKPKKEAETLYNEAIAKYKKAIEIKNDYYEAFSNWGITISNKAITKNRKEAEALYNEAIAKSKKSTDIKDDYYKAFDSWAVSLVGLAKIKSGEEAEELFNEAIKKLKKAIGIKTNSHNAYFNLSCIYALQSKTSESIEELKKAVALNKKKYTKEYILKDTDFKNIEDTPEFQAFLNEL